MIPMPVLSLSVPHSCASRVVLGRRICTCVPKLVRLYYPGLSREGGRVCRGGDQIMFATGESAGSGTEEIQDEVCDAAFVDAATDRSFARGIRDGERATFERSFRAYAPRLKAFAVRCCGDHDRAADLVQDAFIRLWQSRSRIQPDRGLRNYLYMILLNLYRDEARRPTLNMVNIERIESIPDQGTSKQAETDGELPVIKALRSGLARLDADDRAMLFMVKTSDMTCVEVARVFNVSEKTVRRRLKRMVQMLTDEVDRCAPAAGRRNVWVLL